MAHESTPHQTPEEEWYRNHHYFKKYRQNERSNLEIWASRPDPRTHARTIPIPEEVQRSKKVKTQNKNKQILHILHTLRSQIEGGQNKWGRAGG